uniref:L,D-transpeptidase family protein n=1 Tax=Actinotalea sp. C106 TaxID=2908644 RepID=UPI0020291DAC
MPHRATATITLALAILLAAGCSQQEPVTPDPRPTTTGASETERDDVTEVTERPTAPEASKATTALAQEVTVHESPGGSVTHTFDQVTPSGVPLTFMVLAEEDGWLEVQLPVRPNGTSGWVSTEQVVVLEVPYRLEVSTAENSMDLYRHGLLVSSFSVATGTGDTPTPRGTYYLTELIAPTNPGYGPFAYGVSAFS